MLTSKLVTLRELEAINGEAIPPFNNTDYRSTEYWISKRHIVGLRIYNKTIPYIPRSD
jgi:hypothetical protein